MDDDPTPTPAERDADGPPVPLAAVLAAADHLRAFGRPWWVAGGWAIDLVVGRPTRVHSDLEVGVWRDDQAALRAFWPDRVWRYAADGTWLPWAGERLAPPLFQLRAADPASGRSVDVFLNDRAADGPFVCRRDDRVRRPADRLVVRSPLGPPALAPEVQLLYKAKYARPKDEHDLTVALPGMCEERRSWLGDAVATVHPGLARLARLGGASDGPG